MSRAYAAIVSESERTGLPTAYRRDLDYHDLRAIESRPGEPFLWALYESGTHLYFVRPDCARSYATREMPKIISQTWPDALFYLWDGTALLPCRNAEEARERIEEAEKRYGANVDPFMA